MVEVRAGSGLRRGLAVLRALGSEQAVQEGGLGVVRVAELVGDEKSSVSRALAVLADEGFVERTSERRYRLGWALLTLATRAGDARLLATAAPVLERLVAELGETAHLSVRRGPEVVTVASRAPERAVRAVGWAGRTVPASCTASGRALLFDAGPEELAASFDEDLPRPTPAAPADAAELAARVAAARSCGAAVVDEELEPGLVAVAAPVRDARGQIVAALNVSGPKFRLGPAALDAAAEAVRRAAEELSGALGAAGRP